MCVCVCVCVYMSCSVWPRSHGHTTPRGAAFSPAFVTRYLHVRCVSFPLAFSTVSFSHTVSGFDIFTALIYTFGTHLLTKIEEIMVRETEISNSFALNNLAVVDWSSGLTRMRKERRNERRKDGEKISLTVQNLERAIIKIKTAVLKSYVYRLLFVSLLDLDLKSLGASSAHLQAKQAADKIRFRRVNCWCSRNSYMCQLSPKNTLHVRKRGQEKCIKTWGLS